jgi:translation initiation factor 2 beta subunit (eIF-2beta)/eIF-5
MHRQPEHVIQFLFTELGTSGSIDGSQRLVIKGRFQQKQIENVLRRYIGMLELNISFTKIVVNLDNKIHNVSFS